MPLAGTPSCIDIKQRGPTRGRGASASSNTQRTQCELIIGEGEGEVVTVHEAVPVVATRHTRQAGTVGGDCVSRSRTRLSEHIGSSRRLLVRRGA